MSLPVTTRPYRFYQEIVGPACGLIAWIAIVIGSVWAIYVANEIVITATREGTNALLMVSMIFLSCGIATCALVYGVEEDPSAAAVILACAAVLMWIVVGLHIWLRSPVVSYSRYEVRVTHDRKVMTPGQSVPRGIRNAQSEAVSFARMTDSFKTRVLLEDNTVDATIIYTAKLVLSTDKHTLVQQLLDKNPDLRVSDVDLAIPQATERLAQGYVERFVRSENIKAVGQRVPNTPEQLAMLRVDKLELVKYGP